MAYFPHKSQRAYKCEGCGRWFIKGNVSCCVMHAPGTCCHYGDTPLPDLQQLGEQIQKVDTPELRRQYLEGRISGKAGFVWEP